MSGNQVFVTAGRANAAAPGNAGATTAAAGTAEGEGVDVDDGAVDVEGRPAGAQDTSEMATSAATAPPARDRRTHALISTGRPNAGVSDIALISSTTVDE